MPIMEISIVPLGTKTPSVSKYIVKVLKLLKNEKSIKYQLTAMGTIIEASSLDKLLAIAKKMHKTVLNGDVNRIVTTIKIDERKDKSLTIEGKLKSVRKKL
jgi:uncharacterized protein (TIGR00106 family)